MYFLRIISRIHHNRPGRQIIVYFHFIDEDAEVKIQLG